MAWEDLFWEIHKYVEDSGKKKQFNEELKKLEEDEQWRYSDTRSLWQEAYYRIQD
tara:strand:+ start:904 stop:1068 length:165 start_codon:yes stop_codon:yes gene_type:complete